MIINNRIYSITACQFICYPYSEGAAAFTNPSPVLALAALSR